MGTVIAACGASQGRALPTQVVSCPPASTSTVTLYGRPGTFGTLDTTVPSGQDLRVEPIDGWQLDPGQTAYFSTVTPDGTVFLANLPQTANEIMPTACDMVVTCFNPRSAVCDDGAGGGSCFSNLRVPQRDGTLSDPAPCPVSTRSANQAHGADIGDLEVLDPGDGQTRVFFDSTAGSISLGNFPAFGAIHSAAGLWRVDPTASRWPADFQGSSAAGTRACPSQSGQVACGSFSELAHLPRSLRLVIGQYAPAGIVVADTKGVVRASYQAPAIEDSCNPGSTLTVSVREVDADPSSAPGDERFVVIYDTSDPRGQPIQEFRYDDGSSTLVATSAPVLVESGIHPAGTCTHGGQGQTALYDSAGNLWVVRSFGIDGQQAEIFLRDPATHELRLETDCSAVDPATGTARPWGTACTGDTEVGVAFNYGGIIDWSFPWTVNLIQDPKTHSMVVFPFGGGASLVDATPATGGGLVLTSRTVLDVGLDKLEPLGTDETLRSASKGSVDAASRLLWIPISTLERVGPAGCDFASCNPATGKPRDSFLFSADLDRLAASMPAVVKVEAPASVAPGASVTLTLTTSLSGAFDDASSALRVYEGNAAKPVASVPWTRACSHGSCAFRAAITPSVTAAAKGRTLVWHALLFDRAGHTLHTVGRVPVRF